jgi:hypothetical protein
MRGPLTPYKSTHPHAPIHLENLPAPPKKSQEYARWCGLLIHTETLELSADYSRYSGQHISTSLTLPLGRRPGQVLMGKVLQYMRPKCHALLLDDTINGPTTVRLNIFQVRDWWPGRWSGWWSVVKLGLLTSAPVSSTRRADSIKATPVNRPQPPPARRSSWPP